MNWLLAMIFVWQTFGENLKNHEFNLRQTCENTVLVIKQAGIYPWPMQPNAATTLSVWALPTQDVYVQELNVSFDNGELWTNFYHQFVDKN